MRNSFISVVLAIIMTVSVCMPVSATEIAGEGATVTAEFADSVEPEEEVEITEEEEEVAAVSAEEEAAASDLAAEEATTGNTAAGEAAAEPAATAEPAAEEAAVDSTAEEAAVGPTEEETTAGSTEATEDSAEAATEGSTDAAAAVEEPLITEAGSTAEMAVETEETDIAPVQVAPEGEDFILGEDLSPDALFEAYVDEEFGIPNEIVSEVKSRTVKAGSRLGSTNKKFYNYMCGQLPSIAAGSKTSTTFAMSMSDLGFGNKVWTPGELGLSKVVSNNEITPSATTAVSNKVGYSSREILSALLADQPYLLYWFDKTISYNQGWYWIKAVKVNGTYCLKVEGSLSLQLPVVKDYSKTGAAGTYEINPSTGQRVRTAASNAAGIVAKYRGNSDLYIMRRYRDEICNLTSYDHNAPNNKPYGDPWQLISVFDGDYGTNVVCEGYSKAFKYLCDQTAFEVDVDCRVVSGDCGGPHMWNIVCMDGTDNYHVDVTNCDTGTIGADYNLFLVAYYSGSVSGGYTFRINGQDIKYTYDADTISTWGTENLKLKNHGFCTHPGSESYIIDVQPSCKPGSMHKVCSYCGDTVTKPIPATGVHRWNTGYTVDKKATSTSTGSKSIHCAICGKSKPGTSVSIPKVKKAVSKLTITGIGNKVYTGKGRKLSLVVKDGSVTLKMGTHYTVSYKNNVYPGTATVTIKGLDNYTGSVTKKFKIKKAANTITARNFTRSYSSKAKTFKLGVKVKKGKPTYKSNSKSVTVNKNGKVKIKGGFIGKATITITSPNSKYYVKKTKKITVTVNPPKTTLSSAKNNTVSNIQVKWKKKGMVTGYHVQCALDKKFSNKTGMHLKNKNSTTMTFTGGVKGYTYYLRVRTYKQIGKKKFYSGWSKIKAVTIKK